MAERTYKFPIVMEKEPEDPGYFAHSPLLPGCFSSGPTVDETRENMREAVQLHVQMLLEHGDPVPQSSDPVVVEEMRLGISA